MKTNLLNTVKVMAGTALVLISAGLKAQPEHGMRHEMYGRSDSIGHIAIKPNLTEDQQKKISDLRSAHQKDMLNFRNDLAIKEAEFQKYRTADKPDIALINKTIDEIGKLRTDMEKKRVNHEMAVRGLLTDEQKTAFDLRTGYLEHGNRMDHRTMDAHQHRDQRPQHYEQGECPHRL
jgi:Spy/CpxP family protein refolding chaperone